MISSVDTSTTYTSTSGVVSNSTAATNAAASNSSTGSATTSNKVTADVYEKNKTTEFDKSAAQAAIEITNKTKAQSFQKLVNSMFKTQYAKYAKAMPSSNIGAYFANLEVDPQTRAQAQADISENGYWGVEQTAGRILDFAKSIAGDDIDKFNKMKDAVMKGFKQAEDMWGGALPSISGQTYDRVMQGFDEWEKSIKGASAAVE